MKIENKIDVYEISGEEISPFGSISVIIESHWNYNDRFVIKIGDIAYTVLREDMERAIQNACNHK